MRTHAHIKSHKIWNGKVWITNIKFEKKKEIKRQAKRFLKMVRVLVSECIFVGLTTTFINRRTFAGIPLSPLILSPIFHPPSQCQCHGAPFPEALSPTFFFPIDEVKAVIWLPVVRLFIAASTKCSLSALKRYWIYFARDTLQLSFWNSGCGTLSALLGINLAQFRQGLCGQC